MEDRPIRARRATTGGAVVRWCRRNPAVAALLAAVLLVTIAGAGVASYLRRPRDRERAEEREREPSQGSGREQEANGAGRPPEIRPRRRGNDWSGSTS